MDTTYGKAVAYAIPVFLVLIILEIIADSLERHPLLPSRRRHQQPQLRHYFHRIPGCLLVRACLSQNWPPSNWRRRSIRIAINKQSLAFPDSQTGRGCKPDLFRIHRRKPCLSGRLAGSAPQILVSGGRPPHRHRVSPALYSMTARLRIYSSRAFHEPSKRANC